MDYEQQEIDLEYAMIRIHEIMEKGYPKTSQPLNSPYSRA